MHYIVQMDLIYRIPPSMMGLHPSAYARYCPNFNRAGHKKASVRKSEIPYNSWQIPRPMVLATKDNAHTNPAFDNAVELHWKRRAESSRLTVQVPQWTSGASMWVKINISGTQVRLVSTHVGSQCNHRRRISNYSTCGGTKNLKVYKLLEFGVMM